jgi:hypothetical protein
VDYPAYLSRYPRIPARSIPSPIRRPAVYLAGKISPHGWRDDIVGPAIGVAEAAELFSPEHKIGCRGFDYIGPFFIADDHGCGHGPASHGAAATGESECIWWTTGTPPRRIFNINRRRLALATHVFAFINELDCFGTLIELGMAVELRKHIGVAFGEDLTFKEVRELWMARTCANFGIFEGLSSASAWELFRLKMLD